MKKGHWVRTVAAGLSVLLACGMSAWAGGATKKTTAPKPPTKVVPPKAVKPPAKTKPPASAEDQMRTQEQMNQDAALSAFRNRMQTNKVNVITNRAIMDAVKKMR